MADIKQIARLAKVSATTVSRVLNGHPYVSDATREKVLKVVKDEHYFPNAMAANLRRRTSDIIGYLQFGQPRLEDSRMAQMAETALFEAGFKTFLCNADEDQERVRFFLDEMIGQRVAGVVLCPQGRDGLALAAQKELAQAGIVSVLLGNRTRVRGANTVSIDWQQGWILALTHLLGLGHTNIGWLGPNTEEDAPDRLDDTWAQYTLHPMTLSQNRSLYDGVDNAVSRLRGSKAQITALICASEQVAACACRVLSAQGVVVPDKMSILCFGGTDFGRMVVPRMTVVSRPMEDLGLSCAQQLLNLITSPGAPARQIKIENTLTLGNSTGKRTA